MSKFATGLGKFKLMLKNRACKDIMSGFFGGRTSMIQKIIRKRYRKFELTGYKVLFDILDIYPKNIKMGEIYYNFNVRKMGHSKIGNRQIKAYLRSLLRF
jgi:hypothetical protein